MKKILAVVALAGLVTGVASAALQANWAAPGVVTVNDAADDYLAGGSVGTDILSLKCVYQDSGYYFLMTLQAAPTPSAYAQGYMINIDNAAGGAASANSYYIAQGLTGIDYIVDAHYDPFINGGLGGYVVQHEHEYIGGAAPQFDADVIPVNSIVFNTSVDGTQLEWFVPEALVGGAGVNAFASTLNANPGGATFDTGSVLVTPVPEPTGMALLALGVAAIGLRRKFRK